jgi:predicted dehydrogenase
MKIGFIGTRHVHAEGLAAYVTALGSTVVAAHEPDAAAAAAWNASPTVPSVDALLAQCDAVIVAGTNRERVDGVLAASAAGKHVLSEKPVGMNADEVDRLVASVDPERFMVALPLRFSVTFQRAADAVRAGALGTPLAARCTNHGTFPGGWFGDRAEAGGGALQDHIVHISDALCHVFDDSAVRTFARANSLLRPDLDVETSGIATIDFASGMFASIDSSWSRPDSFATWGDVWLEIVGSEGRIRIDPMATHLDHFSDAAGKLVHVGYSDDDMTRTMVAAFLEFAATPGMASPVPLADGVHASDTVAAAYASVASGEPEPVRVR